MSTLEGTFERNLGDVAGPLFPAHGPTGAEAWSRTGISDGLFLTTYNIGRGKCGALVIAAVGEMSAANIVGQLNKNILAIDVLQFATGDEERWERNFSEAARQLRQFARRVGSGVIYLSSAGFSERQLADIMRVLEAMPCSIYLVPEMRVARLLSLPGRRVGNLHCVEFQKPSMGRMHGAAKRALDMTVALLLLLSAAPLLLLIALAVKLDTRGSVLFRQTRLGYRGRPFRIMKFRSMTVLENGTVIRQATRSDARVTRVGRILRMTSLDELPQLINVIKGDMSLVGPRPHAEAHDELFASMLDHYVVRQHVRPGITGWAQVQGCRGETASMEAVRKRVEYDLYYVKNASLWLDIRILLRTVRVVLGRQNAY